MGDNTRNEQLISFFDGRELTFYIERSGVDGQEWIARCQQVPALMTGGVVYNEAEVQNQIKDVIMTAAGVEGDYESIISRNISLVNQISASVSIPNNVVA